MTTLLQQIHFVCLMVFNFSYIVTRGSQPGFVNYKKGCTRLAATSDKDYQLLVHGRWFSPGTLVSSTTKTCRHDIAEILLKVALNTINQITSSSVKYSCCLSIFLNLMHIEQLGYWCKVD